MVISTDLAQKKEMVHTVAQIDAMVGASLETGFGNVPSAVQKISYLLGKTPT